jgi:hypothetical protein
MALVHDDDEPGERSSLPDGPAGPLRNGGRAARLAILVVTLVIGVTLFAAWEHRQEEDAAREVAELEDSLRDLASTAGPEDVERTRQAVMAGTDDLESLFPTEHLSTTLPTDDGLELRYRVATVTPNRCMRLVLDPGGNRVTPAESC